MYLNAIAGILFGTLCVLFINLLLNLLVFPRLRPATQDDLQRKIGVCPMVSILIPARNEADHIEDCARSLVGQRYEKLEVLVLDDQSTDETPTIVQRLMDELPPEQRSRLQLIRGQTLPDGWIGKSFACYQLTQHAQGEYLLFTDADSVYTPDMVSTVILERIEKRQAWQNYIESHFNIARKMADARFARATSWEEVLAIHRRFLRDYNVQRQLGAREPGGWLPQPCGGPGLAQGDNVPGLGPRPHPVRHSLHAPPGHAWVAAFPPLEALRGAGPTQGSRNRLGA